MSDKDLFGRIESIDQHLRSVERRLRAVEKRLSIEPVPEGEMQLMDDRELNEEVGRIRKSLDELSEKMTGIGAFREKLDALSAEMEKQKQGAKPEDKLKKLPDEVAVLRGELKDLAAGMRAGEARVARLEQANRISIGNLKIPVELSGIVAAAALLSTGYLIYSSEWGVLKSWYYSASIGVLFAVAVALKFILTNRKA
ncbi:MAG TPA: hypothetical protein HA257_05080 [Candidatus Methanoperedenaceae archaeon]|nr:hypothetical protein [Candidatus Methanoperedenaceae archaeon]